MNYFIAPRSGEKTYRENISTLKNGVPFENIEPYLSELGKEKLLQEEVIYAWGNREGTKKAWEHMEPGDKVIFYAHKRLVMVGEVYYKEQNPQLALAMWPADKDGNPWEYTFFIKDLSYVSIPIEEFNKVVGYKPNNIIQGFTELKPERLHFIYEQYGTIERYLELYSVSASEEAPQNRDEVYVNLQLQAAPIIERNPEIKKTSPNFSLTLMDSGNPKIKKTDHVKKTKGNMLTGSKGERLVVEHEREYLESLGLSDLAKRVRRVSEISDAYGFDIESFNPDGSPRYIEVKTTIGNSKRIRFYLSAYEIETARIKESYYIYYVEQIDGDRPKITIFENPIINDTFSLEPVSYVVTGDRTK